MAEVDRPAKGQPVVTAVIPTRDRPVLLERAIASALSQDYEGQIEILVVFDQSEVRLPDLGELPANRVVRGVRNVRSPGLAGARNTGILAASGEFVGNCDDDDEWLPRKVSKQVALMRCFPQAPLVGCGVQIVHPAGARQRVPAAAPLSYDDLLFDRHNEIPASSLFARRSALVDGIGLVDESLPGSFAEDWDLMLRAAKVHAIPVVPEVLTRVYWHGGSYFMDRWNMISSALTQVIDEHPKFRSHPKAYARIRSQVAFAEAGAGRPRAARSAALDALRHNPLEKRAYLAMAVSAGVLNADSVMKAANNRGRGV